MAITTVDGIAYVTLTRRIPVTNVPKTTTAMSEEECANIDAAALRTIMEQCGITDLATQFEGWEFGSAMMVSDNERDVIYDWQ